MAAGEVLTRVAPRGGLAVLVALAVARTVSLRAEEPPAAPAGEPPPIASIEIKTFNVFTPEEASKAFFPYRLANLIHFESRKSFIARELTFDLGDRLDPEKLAETERNLRALSLFRTVSVKHDGPNVTVQTYDAWTLLLRGGFSRKGGVTTWTLGAEEANFLGSGKGVAFRYDKDVDRSSKSVSYSDPSFLAPYTVLGVSASDFSDGHNLDVGVVRPFYKLELPRAGGAQYRQALFDTRLYGGGREVAKWKERSRTAGGDVATLVTLQGGAAVRVRGSVEWSDVAFQSGGPLGAPPPAGDRRFLFFMAGFEREGRDWIERRQVDKMDRDEDFNLSPSGRLDIGASPGFSGGPAAGRVRGQGSVGALLPSGLALATVTLDTRIQEDGLHAGRLTGDLRGYVLRENVTVAGRLGVSAGWRLDPEQQVELDGENGVRGYRLHAVAGTGRALANLEVRVFLVSDILQLLSVGVAAFCDAGMSWGDPDGFHRLADVGVGMRFGITRASKNALLRVDVARGLHSDPLGRTGWLLSFSSGQAF